jgi:hypothetical protein
MAFAISSTSRKSQLLANKTAGIGPAPNLTAAEQALQFGARTKAWSRGTSLSQSVMIRLSKPRSVPVSAQRRLSAGMRVVERIRGCSHVDGQTANDCFGRRLRENADQIRLDVLLWI